MSVFVFGSLQLLRIEAIRPYLVLPLIFKIVFSSSIIISSPEAFTLLYLFTIKKLIVRLIKQKGEFFMVYTQASNYGVGGGPVAEVCTF